MGGGLFIIVDGPPATGKSTLAPQLAESFRLPLPRQGHDQRRNHGCSAASRRRQLAAIGRAAVDVMLALAAASPVGAVLESNLYRTWAAGELGRLPGLVVEVFCRCDREVARDRYRLRSGTALRAISTPSALTRNCGTTRLPNR